MNPNLKRMPLVELVVARELTGQHRDRIRARVDGPTIDGPAWNWVWNFSAGDVEQNLRFWREEIIAGEPELQALAKLSIDDVIRRILPPNRLLFHSGEIQQLFALTRPLFAKLRDDMNGEFRGARNVMLERHHLAAFLKARWVNAERLTAK